MTAVVRALAHVFRIGLVETLAYPSQIWMRLLMVPLAVAFQYAVYAALYASGRDELGGHTLAQIGGYVALVQILRTLYANNISLFIGQAIRTGQIATYLLRPVEFPWFSLAYTSGRAASSVLTIGVPMTLAFSAFGTLPVATTASGAAGFLALAVAGYLIYNLAFTLAGLLGFYVEFSGEIGWSVELVMMLLGGATVPLTFFPGWLESVCTALPFASVYFLPVEAWLGKVAGADLAAAVAVAWAWVAALAAAVQVMYARGRRYLSIQGG